LQALLRCPVEFTQYTAWAFGQRLRAAGLLSSMRRVASAPDNAMRESFFGTLQLELLDRKTWAMRAELGQAIFEWIEGWYNLSRRHSAVGQLSPVGYERGPAPTTDAAWCARHRNTPGNRGKLNMPARRAARLSSVGDAQG